MRDAMSGFCLFFLKILLTGHDDNDDDVMKHAASYGLMASARS